jgi:copper chaperone CopZ
MKSLQLKIEGMSCGHCLARIEKALKKVEGVSVSKVLLGHADLLYDPARASVADLLAAVDDAGYVARAVEPAAVLA